MKYLKKTGALLLALVMVLALSAPAFAEEGTSGYTITISNAQPNVTYSAFKIFDVTTGSTTSSSGGSSGSTTNFAYTIESNSPWLTTIQNFKVKTNTTDTEGTTYFTLNQPAGDNTIYIVTTNTVSGVTDDAIGKQLAEVLDKAYTEMNDKPNHTGTTMTSGSIGSVESNTIGNLPAGYYFVRSSLGSVCSLDTVSDNTTATITEKNAYPTIDKQVFDPNSGVHEKTYTPDATESTGNGTWRDVGENAEAATVDVSQNVYYKLVIKTSNVQEETATGVSAPYIIEDTLPTGFTYSNASIKIVSKKSSDTSETEWSTSSPDDYSVEFSNQMLKITLNADGKLKTLTTADTITITYSATMTAAETNGVKIGVNGQTDGTTVTPNSAANDNTVVLYYQKDTSDNKIERGSDTATVYTYQIGGDAEGEPIIKKVDGTTDKPLGGVKFVLSKTVSDATYYAKVSEVTASTAGSYYLTGWTANRDEVKNDSGVVTDTGAGMIVTSQVTETTAEDGTKTYSGGTIEIKGLDAGTYILTEVETLPGYNLLADTITVVIAENGTVTYQYTSKVGQTGETAGNTITIENNTGTELPSTGGMGTTLFYIIGGILAVGAAVLLITRRRMNSEK